SRLILVISAVFVLFGCQGQRNNDVDEGELHLSETVPEQRVNELTLKKENWSVDIWMDGNTFDRLSKIAVNALIKNQNIKEQFLVTATVSLSKLEDNAKIRAFEYRLVPENTDSGWRLTVPDAFHRDQDPLEPGRYYVNVTIAISRGPVFHFSK